MPRAPGPPRPLPRVVVGPPHVPLVEAVAGRAVCVSKFRAESRARLPRIDLDPVVVVVAPQLLVGSAVGSAAQDLPPPGIQVGIAPRRQPPFQVPPFQGLFGIDGARIERPVLGALELVLILGKLCVDILFERLAIALHLRSL